MSYGNELLSLAPQVFGDRTLAEHEVVGELMGQLADADSSAYPYRHIFVRLRDIEAVSLSTMQRTVSFDASVEAGAVPAAGAPRSLEAGPQQIRSPRSALTALIDSQSNRCGGARVLVRVSGAVAFQQVCVMRMEHKMPEISASKVSAKSASKVNYASVLRSRRWIPGI